MGKSKKKNLIGRIFDFHFKNGETAIFMPYFCNKTRPCSTYVYTGSSISDDSLPFASGKSPGMHYIAMPLVLGSFFSA